jgi:hypothetical protein
MENSFSLSWAYYFSKRIGDVFRTLALLARIGITEVKKERERKKVTAQRERVMPV